MCYSHCSNVISITRIPWQVTSAARRHILERTNRKPEPERPQSGLRSLAAATNTVVLVPLPRPCGTKTFMSPERPWTSLFMVKTLPDPINWQNHDFTNVRAGQPSCGPDVDCRASSIHQCLISPSLGYGQSSGTCCGSGSLHCATTEE